MPKSNVLLGTNIPFVQAHHIGSKQRPTAIVLRTSFTTGVVGAANAIAQAWHNPNNHTDSCHYVIDELKTIRCIPDRIACRSVYSSSRYNRKSITINVCYDPPQIPAESTVYRTSKQVARLCRLYRIRNRILNEDEIDKWVQHPWKFRGGIIIATAGDFPITNFITSVQEEYRKFD